MIRTSEHGRTLELPIGKVLHKSLGLEHMRISPKGDAIAISDFSTADNSIGLVTLSGAYRKLASGLDLGGGIAWRPDGREVWFTSAGAEAPPNLYAVDLDGRTRLVLRSSSWVSLYDIAFDGRALIAQNGWRGGMSWYAPGATDEAETSWLDWSQPEDLSRDGKTLLFTEGREGGGGAGSVYLRRSPTEPAVRLGDGGGLALSPDGKWALARTVTHGGTVHQELFLLPTGTGERRVLSTGALNEFSYAVFLPESDRVVVRASEPGKRMRLYLLGVAPGPLRALTEEGANGPIAHSPDGRFVASRVTNSIRIVDLTGNETRSLPGQQPGEVPIAWTADGTALYVGRLGGSSVEVFRVDAATGSRQLWKRLSPPDPAGVEGVSRVLLTPDAKAYVYGYGRRSSELFVVEGLK